MPQVYNGCGTWYYGRKNVVTYQGVCNSCRRQVALSSHDTRLWVVVVFIPIIPLGKKRIIDKCPACTRHMAMNYADYEQGRKRTQEAIGAYRRKLDDAQLAEDALKLVVAQRDVPAFLELAPEIERGMKTQSKPLAMTASVYELFSRIPDAERLLRAALEAAKDDEEERNCSELLANNLLRQNKPEEAEPLLEHIVVEGIPDRVDAIYHLGQAYQRKGNHEKAIAAFDQCQIIFPQMANDKLFNQLREASLKVRGTGKAVDPGKVIQSHKSAASRKKMAKVVPVVVLLAVGAYCAMSWIEGMKAPVYFVNGLDHPYDVKVNGASYSLPANRATKLRIPEGQIKVEMPGLEPETVAVRSSFVSRPFNDTVNVINPDGAAVLERNTMYYARRGTSAPNGQSYFYAGRTYYTFDKIDYPFEDFPRTLEVKSSSGTTSKQNVEVAFQDHRLKISPAYLLSNMSQDLGPERVLHVVERRAMLENDHAEYLEVLRDMVQPEPFLKFLEAGLAGHKDDVWWNREYQYSMSLMGRGAEVEKTYQDLLAKEPGNKTRMFLAGNASPDPDHYLKLVRDSAASPDPCPHAFTSLAKYYLGVGDVHEAAQWGEKAMSALPDDTETRDVAAHAYTADKQFDRALTILLTDENGKFPLCVRAIVATNYVYCLQGKGGEADGSVAMAEQAVRELGNEAVQTIVARLTAERQYIQGNVNGFAAELGKSSALQDAYHRQVALGNLASATTALGKLEKPDADDHLLMYIAAKHKGDANLANRHLEAAVGILAKGGDEDKAYAAALTKTATVPLPQLVRMRDRVGHKLLALTALGLVDPEARKVCFEMAGKMNYEKRFPQHLVEAVLASDR